MTKRRKVTLVMGTRPETIKLAPVVLQCLAHRDRFDTEVLVTAQHRQMLDQVLECFSIKPHMDLNLMKENQGLADLTAQSLTTLESLWRRAPPDLVLVQGDTTSSFTASLAAYYVRVPIGHIEAGLRTRDKYAPFPEEMNRRFIDAMADYHFAPTEASRTNLLREGVPERHIYVTGNTGIDALMWTLERLHATGFVPAKLAPEILSYKKLILVTAHRRENFGSALINICAGVKAVAHACPDAAIVYPVHPNPNVKRPVYGQLGGIANIYLTDPLDYQTFIYLMERADVILTDSGGIQEEAPSLEKPVLVMRSTTERTEAIESGMAMLIGTEPSQILERTLEALTHPRAILPKRNPFGDGHASERIVRVILEHLG